MSNEDKNKQEMPKIPPVAPPSADADKQEDDVATGAMPPKRVFGAWLVVAMLVLSMVAMFYYKPKSELKSLDQLEFRRLAKEGLVEDVSMVREPNGITYLRGAMKEGAKERFRVNVLPTENLQQFILENNITCPVVNDTNYMGAALQMLLPVLLLGLLFYFLFIRQIKSASMGAMNFGKSRAKMLNQDKKKVTFSNVAGIQEAKEEVQEIVEFLKDPQKFQKLGGRIPKGVLLLGPPGTGKTLLAKAIAGEADRPFFSISGSDFVEMFVGVGASRVRDMFEQGKKNAPCLIFIDEIDAVGRSRFSGMGGGHDEREQTLNALLVEMDGFETSEGVIIIAATNRADVLDKALLRPGRFDRQIVVDLPTLTDRQEILGIHAKKIKLAENADLSRIARGTPGFSGADLANLLNEAALIAARHNKEAVEHTDMEEARDKVLWGRERRSRATEDRERLVATAWHEAGHAILQVLCEHTDPLHKVTIIPRGQSLGSTMFLPEKDVVKVTRNQFLDQMVVLTGGRIAEKLHTDDISTGASMDIKQATDIARKMVCAFGMSDAFGFQSFGTNEETLFLGREVTRSQSYSEETARVIDEEVKRLVSEAYARAEQLIGAHRDKLELLVNQLLEAETMDGRDVEDLIKLGRVKNEEERAAEKQEAEGEPQQPEAEAEPAAPEPPPLP